MLCTKRNYSESSWYNNTGFMAAQKVLCLLAYLLYKYNV